MVLRPKLSMMRNAGSRSAHPYARLVLPRTRSKTKIVVMFRITFTPLLIVNLLACPWMCLGEAGGRGSSEQAGITSDCRNGCCGTRTITTASPWTTLRAVPAVPASGTPQAPRRPECNCSCLCRGAVVDQHPVKLQHLPGSLKPVLREADGLCVKAAVFRSRGFWCGPVLGKNASSGRLLCVTLRALLL